MAIAAALVLIAGFFGAGSGPRRAQQVQTPSAALGLIAASLVDFARHHHRLPCVDVDGDGFEGGSTGCGTASPEAMFGRVPFVTLGLVPPSWSGGLFEDSFVYAVFRAPSADRAADADLTRVMERNGDPRGHPGYQSRDDMLKALTSAIRQGPAESALRVPVRWRALLGDCGETFVDVAFVVASGPVRCLDGGEAAGAATRSAELLAMGLAELLGRLRR